jgi:hypothetical protein
MAPPSRIGSAQSYQARGAVRAALRLAQAAELAKITWVGVLSARPWEPEYVTEVLLVQLSAGKITE